MIITKIRDGYELDLCGTSNRSGERGRKRFCGNRNSKTGVPFSHLDLFAQDCFSACSNCPMQGQSSAPEQAGLRLLADSFYLGEGCICDSKSLTPEL